MKDFDLYPIITPQKHYESSLTHLTDIIAHSHVSALRLNVTKTVTEDFIKALTSLLHRHNVALIIASPLLFKTETFLLSESDGFHFSDLAALRAGLPALKPYKLQVGCFCDTLDDAMYAGETGADYISFPAQSVGLIEKWSGFAELPCVAEQPLDPASALQAIEKGADFVSFQLNFSDDDKNWLQALLPEKP